MDGGTIDVGFRIDTTSLKRGLDEAKTSVKQAGNQMDKTSKQAKGLGSQLGVIFPKFGNMVSGIKDQSSKMQSSLKGMGASAGMAKVATVASFAAIGVAVAAAVAKAVQAIWKFMDATAQLADTQKDAEAYIVSAFGTQGNKALEWSRQVSEAYGIYDVELQKTMAGLGSLFRSTGIADEQAIDMAKNYTTLAYDISEAYSNISLEEAQNSLKALAGGEMGALKKLGIALSEVDIKNYAIAKGFAKQGQELTGAQKQMAAYGIIMGKIGSIEGAYLDDTEDYDRVMGAKGAAISELKETLGKTFLPVVNAVNKVITGIAKGFTWLVKYLQVIWGIPVAFIKGVFMPTFELIGKAINRFVDWIKRGINSIVGFLGGDPIFSEKKLGTKKAEETVKEFGETTKDTVEEVKQAFRGMASFDKLTTLGKPQADPGTGAEGHDEDILGILADPSAVSDATSNIFDDLKRKAEEFGRSLNPFSWIDKLKDYNWSNLWTDIKTGAANFWNDMGQKRTELWEKFKIMGSNAWTNITKWGSTTWENMKIKTSETWTLMEQLGSSAWANISTRASDSWSAYVDKVSKNWESLKNLGKDVWTAITDFATGLWERVATSIKSVFRAVIDAITGWLQPIIDSVNWVVSKVSSVTGKLSSIKNKVLGAVGLASGGIAEPNDPRLVVVGDNKTEREFIAPESAMKQAVREVVSEMMGSGNYGKGSDRPITMVVNLDSREIARTIYQPLQSEAKRRGSII